MHSASNPWKSLSTALLFFGLIAGAFAGTASAETLTLSLPTTDDTYFTPGESMTITFGGMDPADHYDLTIENESGGVVQSWWNQSSTTGTWIVTITINNDWDGTYVVYAYLNGSIFWMNYHYFYVRLFTLSASADHSIYLPGDHPTIFYYTQRIADQKALSAGNGQWRMTVQRDSSGGPVSENLGNTFLPSHGDFSFELPSTTRAGYYLMTVTYNDTTNMHSETDSLYIYVGSFNLGVSTDRSTYAPGDSVVVTVTGTTQGTFQSEPTPGASVTLKIDKYDTTLASWNEDTSFAPKTQATDFQGVVSFLVPLPTGLADDTQFRAHVTATQGGTPQEATDTFTIRAATGLSIDLTLDKTTYKPGETLKAHLAFVTTNNTLRDGAMYRWSISDSDTGRVFVMDYAPGTSTGADLSFVIPADFTGELYVTVTVYTPDDLSYTRSEYASVFSYSLLINPSKSMFNPGDTITVQVSLVTDRVSSAAFYWTVTPSSGGDALAKGNIPAGGKSGSFQFTVPGEPEDSYSIAVTAEGGGLVARDTTSVARAKYSALQITVPDKSYKPGDTVTIHYTFSTVGGATPPTTTTITVYLGVYPYYVTGSARSFDVDTSTSLSGDLQYVIPASISSTADVPLTATSGGFGSSSTTLFVRPSAGSSPASSASTTATWGLVLAVLALFVAGFALMKRPSGGGDSASRRSSYDEMKSDSRFKVDEANPPKPVDRVMMTDPNDKSNEPPKSL